MENQPQKNLSSLPVYLGETLHSQIVLLVIKSCKLSLNSASLAAHPKDVLIDKDLDNQIKNPIGR